MITKEQAIELGNSFGTRRVVGEYQLNKNGTFTDCKVNGKCKVWVTRPLEFSLPIKIGFRGYGYITQVNAIDWFLTPEEAEASIRLHEMEVASLPIRGIEKGE